MIKSKRTLPLYFVILFAILAAGCAPVATPAPTEVLPTPTALQLPTAAPATSAPATTAPTSPTTTVASGELTGDSLYQLSCAACHGQDRVGISFTKDGQKISTPSLQWSELAKTYATDPSRGSVTDQVALSIVKGQDEKGADLNTMMPRWSTLSKAQIDSLVQYLQTAATTTGAAPTLTPAATALQGEQLYKTACVACHGSDGAGKTFEKDDNKITTPSLSWGDLTKLYATDPSRGTVEQQFALAITKGQDEKGEDLNPMMPRWSSLSQAQVDSLVQFFKATFK
jgi:mono/diheme cytochrome c family protein